MSPTFIYNRIIKNYNPNNVDNVNECYFDSNNNYIDKPIEINKVDEMFDNYINQYLN